MTTNHAEVRAYINERMNDPRDGLVTYAEIKDLFGEISRQQLKVYKKTLKSVGTPIEGTLDGREGVFFNPLSLSSKSLQFRYKARLQESYEISDLLAHLILGEEIEESAALQKEFSQANVLPLEEAISRNDELKSKVADFKKARNLTPDIFIDSSVAAIMFFERLARTKVSLSNKLTIWTNSPSMSDAVMNFEISNYHPNIRFASIGGAVNPEAGTICARLARESLLEHIPKFSMAIISPQIIYKEGLAAVEKNDDSSKFKEIIMNQSELTVATVDSTRVGQHNFTRPIGSLKTKEHGFDLALSDSQCDLEIPEAMPHAKSHEMKMAKKLAPKATSSVYAR